MKKIYSLLLRLLGWKTNLKVEIPSKCVICVAPHTSNWDFFIGLTFYKSIGGNPHFLMKKDWFFFPLKYILKAVGGIPVDRKKKSSLTDQMVDEFSSRDQFQLAIAPEGTRGKNAKWKSGFYYIAYNAHVPITLAYLDYAKREVGIVANYYPTGNVDNEIEEIKKYYRDITAKHPERFST